MAHECPECGLTCRCGGDIDDLVLNDPVFVNPCSHCDHNYDDDDLGYYDPDTDCPRCQGSGQVTTESHESYFGDNYKTCPTCGGEGTR